MFYLFLKNMWRAVVGIAGTIMRLGKEPFAPYNGLPSMVDSYLADTGLYLTTFCFKVQFLQSMVFKISDFGKDGTEIIAMVPCTSHL